MPSICSTFFVTHVWWHAVSGRAVLQDGPLLAPASSSTSLRRASHEALQNDPLPARSPGRKIEVLELGYANKGLFTNVQTRAELVQLRYSSSVALDQLQLVSNFWQKSPMQVSRIRQILLWTFVIRF